MNDEKFEKFNQKILGIFVCIMYIFIALCIFFIIAVSRVDAKENLNVNACWFGGDKKACDTAFDISNLQGKSIALDLNNVPSGTLSYHTSLTMNLWNWQSGDSVNVSGGYYFDNTYYSCDSGNQNNCYMRCPTDGNWVNCEMWIDTFLSQNDVKVTSVYFLNGNTFNRTFLAKASGSATLDKSTGNLTNGSFNTAMDNQTNTIINNQDKNQQQTNEKLDDLNDSLNDSNVDDSLGTAGNFFNSFEDKDHGGLSGIITAPLVAINKMLSKECTAMTGTYEGTEFSLPSGCDFWSRIKGVQDFLNVVEGGMLCYLIIRQMFFLVQSLKNPEEDRVEVMDL